jgi:hypothetical protein
MSLSTQTQIVTEDLRPNRACIDSPTAMLPLAYLGGLPRLIGSFCSPLTSECLGGPIHPDAMNLMTHILFWEAQSLWAVLKDGTAKR